MDTQLCRQPSVDTGVEDRVLTHACVCVCVHHVCVCVCLVQVAELLASTVTSSAHPHAIDGSALLATARAESAAPTTADAPAIAPTMRFPADPVASDTPETLDIVNMLDQWVTGLEQAAGAISSLERAQGAAVAGGGGRSPRGMAGGGGRLFAPVSDSTGHAALLATQLRLHQDQEGQLQDLVARLKLRVMETGTVCMRHVCCMCTIEAAACTKAFRVMETRTLCSGKPARCA